MFPAPEEVLSATSGTLEDVPFPLLLAALFRAERTCVLELKRLQLEKQIHLEEGVPVACFSNLVHETLGHLLLEKGKLTEAQHLSLHSESVLSGASVADLVVRKQLVAPFELYKLMQGSLARQLLDCFRWEGATFHLGQGEQHVESPIRMSPLRLIFTGVTSVLPFEAVTARLAFDEGDRFGLSADADLAELKLAPKELRFVNALRGSPTFAELTERSGLDIEQALRRLYALAVVGCVTRQPRSATAPASSPLPPHPAVHEPPQGSFTSTTPPGGAQAPAPLRSESSDGQAPWARPPSAEPPAQSAEVDQDADALMAEFLSHRNKDAFDVLGVTPDALPAAFRRAFLAKADRFAPMRFRGTELRERAEALLVAYAKAFGELSTPEQLVLLRKRREAATARKAQGPVRRSAESQFRIKTTLLDASAQFVEGQKRLGAEQWRQAVEYFEYAFNIEAKARHRAYLAWARYRLNPTAHAKLALTELAEAQRADSSCAEAFGFAGDIHRALGDVDRAEAAYRTAQRLDPAEKRYAKALGELPRARR